MKQFSRPSLRKWWRGQTLSEATSMVNVLLLVSQTYAKVTFQVIIGMREFRSTLRFLLHRSNLFMIPGTLTIVDYILTPEICVERKSLLNLILSFNSGRLYVFLQVIELFLLNPFPFLGIRSASLYPSTTSSQSFSSSSRKIKRSRLI